MHIRDKATRLAEDGNICSFGITEGIAAVIGGLAADAGATAAVAGTIGTVGADALVGAGVGAAGAGLTGGNPLTGALTGGLTGGVIGGFGGPIGSALGIGATGGDILAGAGAGALGAGVTGSNPLTGAITGGVSGGVAGLLTPTGTPGGAASPGAGASAASAAAPAGITGSGGAPIDLTGGGAAIDTAALTSQGVGSVGGTSTLAAGQFQGPSNDITLNGGTGNTVPLDLGGGSGGGGAGGLTTGSASPSSNATLFDIGNANGPVTPGLTVNDATGTGIPDSSGGTGGSGSGGKTTGWQSIQNAISNPTGSNIGSALTGNAGALVAGGGLLYNILGNQNLPGAAGNAKGLEAQANTLAQQGSTLESYLQSGQLPPGAAAAIQNATASAQAAIRSRYAASGQTGSSAETQELNQVQMNAAAQSFQFADQLMQQGINETGLSSQLYESLIGLDQKQSASMGSAIANFAAALAGSGGGGQTFKLTAA